jgi:hypothetical protein
MKEELLERRGSGVAVGVQVLLLLTPGVTVGKLGEEALLCGILPIGDLGIQALRFSN